MNTQQKRALLLIKLAKRKEDQAAEVLGHWRQRMAAQTEQLAELGRYQSAYLDAARKPSQSVYQLQSYRQFLTQLDHVIAEQQARMLQIEQQFEHYCQQWRLLHQRRKMLEDYQSRIDQDAQKAINKLWDKMCDELSARPSGEDSALL